MNIPVILLKRFSSSAWSLAGEEYGGLVWLSNDKRPTEKELKALWPKVEYEVIYEQVEQARQVAYRETADPLFFEYQRGDKTEAVWLAAVQAVKDSYPYPEAP